MDRIAPGDMVLTYGTVLQAPFDVSSLLKLGERTRFGTQEATLIDRCTVRRLWSSTC